MTKNSHFRSVDDYIQSFPKEVQTILSTIRSIIKELVPEAVDAISYNMPTMRYKDTYIIHFAAWQKHIALYPLPAFQKKIEQFKGTKSSAHFLLNKPMPYDIIKEIIALRIKELGILS